MLSAWFIIVSIVLRFTSGLTYIRAILKNRAQPNPITWFFWGLAPMIAFIAQLAENVGPEAWITFALGLGPLVIFGLSLFKNWSASHFTPSTIACAIMATTGIVLWQITNDPILAIIFSIIADIFGSIPTVIKAYNQPQTEYAPAYMLSMFSMVIALLIVTNWTFASYAFPAYIFLINLVIFSLATRVRKNSTMAAASR